MFCANVTEAYPGLSRWMTPKNPCWGLLGRVLPALPCTCSILRLLLFSRSVRSDSLRPHEQQHTRLPCPSPSPGVCSHSCSLSILSYHRLNHMHHYLLYFLGLSQWLRSACSCRRLKETQVRSLGWKDPLEKEMTTRSSTHTWEIPWTKEPGGL